MLPEVWAPDASEQYARAFDRTETYIPFRPADLCLLVVQQLKAKQDPRYAEEDLEVLNELNRRLSYVSKLLVAQRFDEWQDSYVMLDPDVDVVLHESHKEQSGDIDRHNAIFQKTLKRALDDGSFEKFTERDLNDALNARSVLGLNVVLPNKSEIQTIIFSRGRRLTTVEIPDWKTLWLTTQSVELKLYQRIVLLVRREVPEKQPSCSLLQYLPWNTEPPLSKNIKPGKMYFKIFKDIEASDVDMLIPGSKVQFTRLDFFLLVMPLLLGLISAFTKAANGTLDFDTMQNAMTSAALVILPLTYAARAYFQFRQKQNAYQANLIKKLALQTVANNSGALTAILDEVADQETMDVLLAYAFLWKGRRVPPVTSRSALAQEVEVFLNELLEINQIETRITFDAKGACRLLEKLGLFQRYSSGPGENWIQVVDIHRALGLLSSVDLTKKLRADSSIDSKQLTTEYEELNIAAGEAEEP